MVEPPSDGFDTFYASSIAAAARLGHLLTGSPAVGHEIAQDAMLAVHQRWNLIENPGGYLRVVIVNLSRTVQRRSIRERLSLRALRSDGTTLLPEYDDGWRAIRRLPARQRAVVVLRFYEDLSIPAIAEVLDIPAGTVKSTLHRALRQLEGLLR